MSGITFVLGCPGSGKSTRALQIVTERAAADGKPILILDPQRVETFAKVHHSITVREVLFRVYDQGMHVAFTPESPSDFERLFKAVKAAGEHGRGVHVLVDESRFFMSGRTIPLAFDLFARVYRHVFATVVCTSQSYQDAGRPLKAVVGEWLIGRMTSPADLDALKADLGLDPAEISTLPKYEFKPVKVGF